MATLTALGRQYPVAAYYALTFLISWGGVLLVIGRSRGMTTAAPVDDPFFVYALVAMLAGPSVAGIVMTLVVGGTRGLDELRARVLAWRARGRWWAVALLTAPVLWTITSAALSGASPAFASGIFGSGGRFARVATGLAAATAVGMFEELGWTGFVIPRLRQRRGIFATGLLVGVLWGAWHVLVTVVWAAPVTAGALPMSVFLPLSLAGVLVGYLTAFRVLMVWVYEHTRSVLVAMAMHTSLTASVLILDPVGLSGATLLAYSAALAFTVWTAVLVVAWRTRWQSPEANSPAHVAKTSGP